jgi:transposase InsO family protein
MADGIACIHAKELADCDACITSKSHRSSHPPTLHRARKVGELIHFDTGDLQTAISMTGKRYYTVFVDDYSRYITIMFHTHKSAGTTLVQNCCEMVKTRHGTYPITLRSDNAKEFKTKALKKYCADRGITQEFTCSYTPEQNGVAERMNQTLEHAASAMLHHSGFPSSYSEYA